MNANSYYALGNCTTDRIGTFPYQVPVNAAMPLDELYTPPFKVINAPSQSSAPVMGITALIALTAMLAATGIWSIRRWLRLLQFVHSTSSTLDSRCPDTSSS